MVGAVEGEYVDDAELDGESVGLMLSDFIEALTVREAVVLAASERVIVYELVTTAVIEGVPVTTAVIEGVPVTTAVIEGVPVTTAVIDGVTVSDAVTLQDELGDTFVGVVDGDTDTERLGERL